jgi:hypothetical protein
MIHICNTISINKHTRTAQFSEAYTKGTNKLQMRYVQMQCRTISLQVPNLQGI